MPTTTSWSYPESMAKMAIVSVLCSETVSGLAERDSGHRGNLPKRYREVRRQHVSLETKKSDRAMQLTQPLWFQSIAVRSFVFTAAFLVLAVGSATYVVLDQFNDYLNRRVHEAGISEARRAAGAAGAMLEGYASVGAVLMADLSTSDSKRRLAVFEAAFRTNREIVALHALTVENGKKPVSELFSLSTYLDSTRLEAQTPNDLRKKLIADDARPLKKTKNASLLSRAEYLGLPIVSVYLPFDASDSRRTRWLVMSLWSDRLAAILPSEDTRIGLLTDFAGKPLISPLSSQALALEKPSTVISKRIKDRREPYGSASEKVGNNAFVDAFAIVPTFKLATVVRTDTRTETAASRTIILRSATAGWIVLMLVLMATFISSTRIIKRLRSVSEATQKIAKGEFAVRIADGGKDEIALVSSAVDQMAGQIVEFLGQEVEKSRLEHEMFMAKEVQSKFFPPAKLTTEYLAISAICRTASECGGDWWGHFAGAPGVEYVFIGDVTGHGAPAALVTAMAYSCCQEMIPMMAQGASPSDLLKHISAMFYRSGKGMTTMTLIAIKIDLNLGEATVANGGHVFPIFVPADPTARLKDAKGSGAKRVYAKLFANGSMIGMEATAQFSEVKLAINQGDRFLLMTDGLIEGRNPKGEEFGEKRFRTQLTALIEGRSADPAAELLSSADSFFAGQPPHDDVTLTTVTITKLAARQETAA